MNTNIQNGYLDIVFANRNKAYGAYELRKNYDKRMMVAAAIATALVALFIGWSQFGSKDISTLANASGTDVPVVLIDKIALPTNEPAEVKINEPKAEHGRTAKTQNFTKANVIKDNALTKPAMTNLDKDALAGPVDNPGLKDGNAIALDNSLSQGGEPSDLLSKKGKDDVEPTTNPMKEGTDQPLSLVSEMPLFPGGPAALKLYLDNNLRYPNMARSNEIQGKVFVSFVVNTDGSIVDVKVVRGVGGGCSEEAIRVIKAMPKWKAGMNNGHKVRVKMTMPIQFAIKD